MHELFFRPPPELRRRIDLASACKSTRRPMYVRLLLTQFLEKPIYSLSQLEGETGDWSRIRLILADDVHRDLRVFAAAVDVSMNVVTNRILHVVVPFEIEALATALNEPATSR